MTDFEPLSDVELDELDEFLYAQMDAGHQSMLLGAAHGFFTAELCGPLPMPFAEAIDIVLGEAEFATPRQEKRMRALLGRLWLEVEAQLDAGEDFEPLLHQAENEDGTTVTLYADWCLGFLDAVENSEAWQEHLSAETPSDEPERSAPLTFALSPIALLAYRGIWEAQEAMVREGGTLDDEDRMDLPPAFRDDVSVLEDAQVQELVAHLGDAVLAIDALAAEWRAEDDGPVQLPLRVEKIGRNDPCPCGSGKKYKKCCGAAANDETP